MFQNALARVLRQIDLPIVKRAQIAPEVSRCCPSAGSSKRTIAWLNRRRRLAKDWENLNRKALAFLRLAAIRLMLRKTLQPLMMFPDRLCWAATLYSYQTREMPPP